MEDPLQLRPPYWGVGLEQLRERVFVPPAHVTVHESHDVQTVQPPSTKRKFKIFNINQQRELQYKYSPLNIHTHFKAAFTMRKDFYGQ